MNRNRLFSLIGAALLSMVSSAMALEINVTEPGTFKDLVIDSEGDISTLVVKGTLNATDVEYLIGNSGRIAQVKHLDISEMRLVESETEPYRRVTINSEAGGGEFAYCYYSQNARVESKGSTGGLGLPVITYYIYGLDMTGLLADTGFEKVTLPNSVSCVADYMCLRALNLQEVTVPTTATRIGRMAFKQTQLKEIELPPTVESIGESAFEWTQLTSVTLPSALTEVGDLAFRSCDQLESINLEKVRKLGALAFQGDGKLKSANLSNVTHIGYQAFLDCPLDELSFSDNLKAIGDQAFALAYAEMKKYAKLTSLQLPEGLDSIGAEAFLNTNLEKVTVPVSVEYIGKGAFEGTPWDKTLNSTAVDNVIYLGEIAYKVLNKPQTVTFREGTKSIAASVVLEQAKNLTLPNTCKSFYVQGDFYNLENVDLGTGLVTIGDRCFYWAPKLTSVVLPESLESIGSEAFGCPALSSLTLPSGLKRIGSRSFMGTSIGTITIPEGLEFIGENSFAGNSISTVRFNCRNVEVSGYYDDGRGQYSVPGIFGEGVEKIVIGANVESLPNGIFAWKYNLVRIEMEDSDLPLAIGDLALDCPYDSGVKLKGSINRVKSIGKYGLGNIEFSDVSFDFPNLVSIGKLGLNNISGVKAITLGPQVKNVSAHALHVVKGLTRFTYAIPEAQLQNINEWETSLMTSVETDSLIISKEVSLIPDNMFAENECRTLVFEPREATRAASSLTIGANAFQYTLNLYCVDFPTDLVALGEKAFYECPELTTVYFHSAEPPVIGANALHRTSTVYVPAESEDSYAKEMPQNKVEPYRLESVMLDKSALSLKEGEADYLIARISPAECSEMAIEWTSSDPSVAVVNSRGDVFALKEGTAVITASIVFDNSFRGDCIVTVTSDTAVDGVEIDDDDSPVVEYYRVDGSKVIRPEAKGVYVGRKANGKSVKIFVK